MNKQQVNWKYRWWWRPCPQCRPYLVLPLALIGFVIYWPARWYVDWMDGL